MVIFFFTLNFLHITNQNKLPCDVKEPQKAIQLTSRSVFKYLKKCILNLLQHGLILVYVEVNVQNLARLERFSHLGFVCNFL